MRGALKERKMKKKSKTLHVLPDWKKSGEYPNPKKTKPEQWAWEFLRRNKKYQEAFKEIEGEVPSPIGGMDFCFHQRHIIKEIDTAKGRVFFSPADTYRGVGNEYPEEAFLKCAKFCRKFGINKPVPPEIDNPSKSPWFLIFNAVSIRVDFPLDFRKTKRQINKEFKLVLDKYWEKRKNISVEKRKLEDKAHLYSDYLRLLDGKESGATYREMAKILYPKNRKRYAGDPDYDWLEEGINKVKNGLKAARLLRNLYY
jgi:hypothetical protein